MQLLNELRLALGIASHRHGRLATIGLAAVAVLSVILANPAWLRSVRSLPTSPCPHNSRPPTGWWQKPALQPWLDDVDV
ncbi:MAG: hypothetical protein R3D25_10100 [Geminicoccaceae bacterium]